MPKLNVLPFTFLSENPFLPCLPQIFGQWSLYFSANKSLFKNTPQIFQYIQIGLADFRKLRWAVDWAWKTSVSRFVAVCVLYLMIFRLFLWNVELLVMKASFACSCQLHAISFNLSCLFSRNFRVCFFSLKAFLGRAVCSGRPSKTLIFLIPILFKPWNATFPLHILHSANFTLCRQLIQCEISYCKKQRNSNDYWFKHNKRTHIL